MVNQNGAGVSTRTYEINVSSRDNERGTGEGDQTELPGEDDTNDETSDQSGGSLNDTGIKDGLLDVIEDEQCDDKYAPRVIPANPLIF